MAGFAQRRGIGTGSGFETVERLPAEPEDGKAYYLERDQQEPFTLDDFDLTLTAAALGNNRLGYASAAGDAAYGQVSAAAGALEGAAAGVEVLARFGGVIEIVVRNALVPSLGPTPSLHVNGTAYPLVRLNLPGIHGVTRAGMSVYSAGGGGNQPQGLAAGDQWAAADTPTLRLIGRNGILPTGDLAKPGDENPAGALLYEAGYYLVIDGEYVQVDPLASGGVPAVRIGQSGNDALGLLVGFEREGAGAPWTLDTIDGTGAPATTRVPAAGANYVTFRFPEAYGDGAAGNTAAMFVRRRAGAIAVETAQNGNEFQVRLFVPAAATMAQVQAALRALPAWEDADVVVTGAGGTVFPSGVSGLANGDEYRFAGGRDHVLELTVDTDTETVELTYHNGIPQQELMDFLDGNETDEGTFRATHVGDTDLAASPEPAPFAGRAFDKFYSGGVRPRRTPEGYTDIVARRAAEAAQTSADAAGAAARTAYDEARTKLGSIVFAQANSQAGLDAAIAEADGSGDLYFLNITGPFRGTGGFDYKTGMTFVWVQSVPGFAQIDENFDPDTIVRLLSFRIHYVSSAAELAAALRTLNNRNGGLVAITADFSSGGVDYVDGERYMWDTADERMRLFYATPPGPPAASAITAGVVQFSNSAPLGPRAGGAAGSDPRVVYADHQHPPPTYAVLEAILDAGTGSAIWRSAHTQLRNAIETRDLLATTLGANWWQGLTGAGITLEQAIDGFGAVLAMRPEFTYDAATNTVTFTLQNDFVTSAMILAGTAAEKVGWRGKIEAAHIGAANDLPPLDNHNIGDVWIIAGNPTPGGNAFVDIRDQATPLDTANPFDVMLVFPGGRGVAKQWTRVGTIGGINAAVQAALDAKADLATLPATVSEALPPFFSITHAPAGIGGGRAAADYPDYIDVVFSEKQTGRTITGATLSIGGAPLPLDASTPISGIDAANELRGLLQFNLTSVGNATRINLAAQVTRHGSRFLPGQLTITFDEGAPHVHDFAWPVQNPAFAIPAAPAVVQAYTAAALAVTNANVTVAQTARITPRSTATRVRLSGHLDAVFANARNNNNNDRFQKLVVSFYRGDVLVISRTFGNAKVASQSHIELAPDIEWIDDPRSAAEQTYTLRVQRLAPGSAAVTVTDRQLIVEEVL